MLEIENLDDLEQAKKRICSWLKNEISERGWSQRKAASYLGLPTPRINQICRGENVRGISLEKLLVTAGKIGEIRISIKPG